MCRLIPLLTLILAPFILSLQGTDVYPSKRALILGVTGQDGYYLTNFLLEKEYEVYGVARNQISENSPISLLADSSNFFFYSADITNKENLLYLIQEIRPDEIYNLAAQSNVRASFDIPEETTSANCLGTICLLQAIKESDLEKKIRFFQATSSEMFGLTELNPQAEQSPFYPRSPYAVTKAYSYWMTVNYRDTYGIFACNGIMFNHESPLRGESFVTRKISEAVSRYKMGLQKVLYLGNIDVKRDWGFAGDYVEAMWMMLQNQEASDYVIATGKAHTVREFVELAFKEVGILIEWKGVGVDEVGVDSATGDTIVRIDPKFYRPNEATGLVGSADKANKVLGWKPKTSFEELVRLMVKSDYQKLIVNHTERDSKIGI